MSYSRRFRHLDPRVIELTRDLVRARPWTLGPNAQLALARRWVEGAARVYRVEPPEVVWGSALLGGYAPSLHRIVLQEDRQLSVVTLLHEFRHSLQEVASEDDARAWSLSLFRRAAPRRFRRMVELGRLLYCDQDDLFDNTKTLTGPTDWFGRLRAHAHRNLLDEWELCTDNDCEVYRAGYRALDEESGR